MACATALPVVPPPDVLQQRWRVAKAIADRLWWQLHKDRVNRLRRERYRASPLGRDQARQRARRRALHGAGGRAESSAAALCAE